MRSEKLVDQLFTGDLTDLTALAIAFFVRALCQVCEYLQFAEVLSEWSVAIGLLFGQFDENIEPTSKPYPLMKFQVSSILLCTNDCLGCEPHRFTSWSTEFYPLVFVFGLVFGMLRATLHIAGSILNGSEKCFYQCEFVSKYDHPNPMVYHYFHGYTCRFGVSPNFIHTFVNVCTESRAQAEHHLLHGPTQVDRSSFYIIPWHPTKHDPNPN